MCINIRQCPALLKLLQSNAFDPAVSDFLRASLCGYEGRDPRVCCPSDGGTTGGDRDHKQITKTEYGPLNPPECGASNVSLRRIVGGEPASLGKLKQFAMSNLHIVCRYITLSLYLEISVQWFQWCSDPDLSFSRTRTLRLLARHRDTLKHLKTSPTFYE